MCLSNAVPLDNCFLAVRSSVNVNGSLRECTVSWGNGFMHEKKDGSWVLLRVDDYNRCALIG